MRSLVPAVLVLAFTVYCVIDVVRSDSSDVRGLPKTFWVVLCLLFPLAGGIAWLVAGRPRSSRPTGTQRLGRTRPSVLGPDDDVDFLRTIDRPRPVAPPAPLDPAAPSAPADGGRAAGPVPPHEGAGQEAAGETSPGAPRDDDGETGPGAPAGTDDRRP